MDHEARKALQNGRRKTIRFLAEAVFHACVVALFLWSGALRPSGESARLFPLPDAPEHAWAALAWAGEAPFLLPIANELHPTRYAPGHGALASLWVRLRGGGIDAVREWSLVALLLGTALLAGAVSLAGGGAVGRCLVVFAMGSSTEAWRLSHLVMQEPTFLVYMGACFSAFAGALLCGDERPRARIGLLVVSGFLAGVLILSRGTLLVLGPSLFLGAVVAAPRRRWITDGAALLAGAAAAAVLVLVAVRVTMGVWRLEGYIHWMPDHDPFHLSVPFEPPRNMAHLTEPQAMTIALDLLGVRRGLIGASPALAVILASLAVLAVLPMKAMAAIGFERTDVSHGVSHAAQGLLAASLSFSAATTVFQAFYFFYEPRFYLPAWAGFAVAAGAAVGILRQRGLKPPFGVRLAAAGAAACCLIFAGAAARDAKRESEAEVLPDFGDMKALGEQLRELDAPLFIDAMPVLNFRILAGLEDWEQPISQLFAVREIGEDGHVVQFTWFNPETEYGTMDDPAGWPDRPDRTWLADPETGETAQEFAAMLAQRHGAVLLLRAEGRAGEDMDLIDRAAGDLGRERAPTAAGWRLERWAPPPNALP